MTGLKLAAAAGFLLSALVTLSQQNNNHHHYGVAAAEAVSSAVEPMEAEHHRRLSEVDESNETPSYMEPLMKDLKERKKLFDETPPEEVKYWFEYTGPLQVRSVLVEGGCNTQSRDMRKLKSIVHPKIEVTLRLRTLEIHIRIII